MSAFVMLVVGWPWDQPPPPPPPTPLEQWSESLVWATGWLGFVLTMAITQMQSPRTMAFMEVVTNSMYIAHFGLLGAMGGLASQTIGFFNGLLSYNSDIPLCKMLHTLLPAALIPLGALTYEASVDLVPLTAVAIRLLAYQFESMLHIRALQVLSSCAWLSYGWLISSSSVMLTSVSCGGLTLLAMARDSHTAAAPVKKTK